MPSTGVESVPGRVCAVVVFMLSWVPGDSDPRGAVREWCEVLGC